MYPSFTDSISIASALYGIDADDLVDQLAIDVGTGFLDSAAADAELAIAYGQACANRFTDFLGHGAHGEFSALDPSIAAMQDEPKPYTEAIPGAD